uniref:Uncharacterized protein n=1 Tax=Oscillatoriales cyanobacterium SpSt-418 TaxID=2282169 RepID=A0A7C3PKK5_9CYAN
MQLGKHSTVLAVPELLKAHSLEVLRDSEAVDFEDLLEIAAQFLQVADGLTEAMQADIQQRPLLHPCYCPEWAGQLKSIHPNVAG